MTQPLFSTDELHKLTVYRRWLFIGFPVGVLLLLGLTEIVCCYIFHIDETVLPLIPILGIFSSFFAFIYCLSKYKEAVRKTAYHLIAQHLNYQLFKQPMDYKWKEELLENVSILLYGGYVEWHNFLQGTQNGHALTLQDISLITPRGGTNSPGTKGQYTLLTVTPIQPLGCNIVLKKKTLLKRGMKDLIVKRMNLQDKEIEKLYDVYADQQEHATMLLNPAFTQALAQYIRTHKKQPELIITPQQICILYNTGIWKKLFSLVIFRNPRVQCEKILKEITNVLDILPVISLLKIS